MSDLHYFQRYSKEENVVTNNTLLLLSRLYAHSILYFEAFLADLLDAGAPAVGVRFTQQDASSGKSVPDGLLEQRSFKVVLETKLHPKPDQDQLTRHLSSFRSEARQILLVLTPAQPGDDFRRELETIVAAYNRERGLSVEPVFTTFRQVIHSYRGALAAHDTEMHYVLGDYEDFCATFRKGELLPRDEYTMRAVPCGKTFEDNVQLAIYYQPVTKPSRAHRYLGIYDDKRVRYIGRVKKIVAADLVGGKPNSEDASLTQKEEDRIKEAIEKASDVPGYDITSGHRFYLLNDCHETSFEKVSPGGLRDQRYFDLADELELGDQESLPSVEKIAERLKGKTWS